MATNIDIDDHGQPLEDIKFKLKIYKDQAEEIMSYTHLWTTPRREQMLKKIQTHSSSLEILLHTKAHLSQLTLTTVMVEWESGEVTYEPLTLISKDDPITCAVYAKKHDLLVTPGWKHLKRYAKTSKRLIRAVKQSRIRQVRAPGRYQHSFKSQRITMML